MIYFQTVKLTQTHTLQPAALGPSVLFDKILDIGFFRKSDNSVLIINV